MLLYQKIVKVYMEFKVNKPEKLIKFIIHNYQGISFGNAQKLIRLGKVKVNGNKCKDNINLEIGDLVNVYQSQKNIPHVEVLFEDKNILIVNKPQGIECATRDKSSENTYSLEEIFKSKNAIVVHRLDRLTEGIVVLARTKEIAKKFEEYFRLKKIEKHYKACVLGTPKDEGLKIAYLKKDSNQALVKISLIQKSDYKEIITEYRIEKSFSKYSLLDINLHTGRTHQIRGYFSFLGHPILQDNKYGKNNCPIQSEYKGYFLTAYKIIFHLDDDLKYLNELNIEIKPSWIKYL